MRGHFQISGSRSQLVFSKNYLKYIYIFSRWLNSFFFTLLQRSKVLHRKEVIKLILNSSHDFDIKCAKPEFGGGGVNKKTTMALLISKKPEFNILIFDFFPLFFGCGTQRHLGN